jgi:Protein of unknown function (DUF1570)
MATVEQVRCAMHREPFRPFFIKLADGTAYQVRHSDFVAVTRRSELVFVGDDEGIHEIDMRLVAEIETPAPASTQRESRGMNEMSFHLVARGTHSGWSTTAMPHTLVPLDSALHRQRPPGLSRRACIARIIAGIVGISVLTRVSFSGEAVAELDDAAEIADVKALGKKAGLAPFSDAPSKNFLGLGDAGPVYCKDALTICEALAPEFLSHFRARGFKLALPQQRMTVITLKDAASYRALLGEDKGAAVGGHYDLETNRLVVFDNRGTDEELPDSPERVNRFTLTHETLHLLSYNTGLLSRQLDVPACISEGLATYGELWQYKGKTKIGATNNARLRALTDPRAGGGAWIPIKELLAKDAFFDDDDTVQLAYAEAWALVHYLLRHDAKTLARFHAYLDKLPPLQDAAKRLKIAEAELGSLEALDKEVKRHAKEQLRKRK